MPFVFNALKINSTLALIGAIVAEFFGTPIVGMGFRISTEVGRMSLDMVWAEIAVAAIAGSAFYGALALLERAVTFWHPSYRTCRERLKDEDERQMKKTGTRPRRCAGARPSATADAADPVTLQLKWVTQAQFAGYYVAKDKGFYEEAGLDVTIKPGGPDIAPPQVIAGGGADVIVDWMPSALASREKGVPLVNIAQPFKRSGMMLTCRKDTGITKPEDFRGKTLGVWFYGNEYPFLSWMAKLGIPTDGSAEGVTVLKQGFNVDPLLQKQADCISTMTYNEYWQVIDAGIKPEDLIVFKYEDQGVATLEDGLYVLRGQPQGPRLRRQDGPLRRGLDEGLGLGARATRRGRRDRARERHHRRPDREAPGPHDGRDQQADRGLERRARPRRLRAHRADPAVRRLRPGDHQAAGGRLDPRRHRRGQALTGRRSRIVALLLAAAALATAGPARAHHWPLLVQLNMPLHAAVAGYFVADYQGFYDEAEIAVSLIPGGPGVEPTRQLEAGAANLIVERMPEALAARERGVTLVNIGQVFARGAMRLVCRADSGIAQPSDLRGRRLGVWADGNRYAVLAWLAGLGLRPSDLTIRRPGPRRRPAAGAHGRLHLRHELRRGGATR